MAPQSPKAVATIAKLGAMGRLPLGRFIRVSAIQKQPKQTGLVSATLMAGSPGTLARVIPNRAGFPIETDCQDSEQEGGRDRNQRGGCGLHPKL
jgi:hypothetical protein